jgi:hypothetical protein
MHAMNPIKIGQIGICHEHASGKITALRSMPDVHEIVGVVDDRDTTAARFASDNNGLTVPGHPHAKATLRICDVAASGISRRRLTVCGTRGTSEVCPLEIYDGSPIRAQAMG